MKKFTLNLFFIVGLVSLQAQESISNDSINEKHSTLILKLGANLVDSAGNDNPFTTFSDFDQMAFSKHSIYPHPSSYLFFRLAQISNFHYLGPLVLL